MYYIQSSDFDKNNKLLLSNQRIVLSYRSDCKDTFIDYFYSKERACTDNFLFCSWILPKHSTNNIKLMYFYNGILIKTLPPTEESLQTFLNNILLKF